MVTRISPRIRMWVIAVVLLLSFSLLYRAVAGSATMLAMWPALEALHAPVQWWQSFELWFVDRQHLQHDYLAFQKKSQQQAALIQEASSLREENRQLRKILEIAEMPGYRWHAAKVRGRSPDRMSQRLIIQVDDVSPDDVIVSSQGLVGVIDRVTSHYATVRTIFDASLVVPVTKPGSALAAVSRGMGDRLAIDFVPEAQAPEAGDLLYTSGAGGLFPPGIAVARVVAVTPVAGAQFMKVDAQPVAHWQRDNWLAVASQLHNSTPLPPAITSEPAP